MSTNPYFDYTALREPVGREETLKLLFTACVQRQSVSLVGMRLIGKSSILIHMQSPELQKRMNFAVALERHIFIYIDMRDYLLHNLDDFFQELFKHIAIHASRFMQIVATSERSVERFAKSLQDVNEAGYHVVLLMDTFDRVEDEKQFGPSFFSFLRSPQTKRWISYITASRKPLYQISPYEEASPLFNGFWGAETIGALKPAAAAQLISEPAEQANQPFSEDEKRWISEQAGRHPFFLQVTCRQLFEEMRLLPAGESADYAKLEQQLFDELAPKFESIWRDLTEEQRRTLKQEVYHASNGGRKIEELSGSALFRRYVSEKFQMEQRQLTAKDVKEALDNRSDRAFLQTCKLAGLHYIDAHDTSDRNMANKRGWLVQELLKEALERMKPTGPHNDIAPEWLLYNIIYYHYYSKTPNDAIAGRLSISRRHFYRQQERAIQAMCDEIMHLDTEARNA